MSNKIPGESIEKFSYALNLRATGDLEEAYSSLLKLSEENPESSNFGALAIVCWEQRQYHESAKYFRKVTTLLPKSERASFGLFLSLWEIDLRDEAYEEMKRFLSISDSKEYEELLRENQIDIEDMKRFLGISSSKEQEENLRNIQIKIKE